MNTILATTVGLLALSATSAQITPLAAVSAVNPFSGIGICASGVEIELGADGLTSASSDTSGLSLTLTLEVRHADPGVVLMRALLLSAALTAAAMPAFATDIVIRDFVGTVSITEGAVDAKVIANETDDLRVTNRDDTITVDGGIERPGKTDVCSWKSDGFEMSVNGKTWFGKRKKADRRFDDYPKLDITVPEGATVTVENSHVALDVEPLLARADLDLSGCRDVTLGDVLEAEIRKSGSGNLALGNVGALDLRKSGSGDVEAGEIGTAEIKLSGAGDLDLDRVATSATIRRSGAGDIEIEQVDGRLSYDGSGAGDLEVYSGTITRLVIDKSGAGDVEIDAEVIDADITASGVGDIELAEVSGSYREQLSGLVEVDRN